MSETPEMAETPEVLSPELEELKKKSAEHFDQLLRLRAEFDNYRKRVEKEKVEAQLWGKKQVLEPLLSLVDVFEQALMQSEKATDVKQVAIGLQFLHKNFEAFLKAEGLEVLEVVGKPLDPLKAEVVEQVETEETQVGHVLSELQRGYALNGRILRPARVRVGVAKKENQEEI